MRELVGSVSRGVSLPDIVVDAQQTDIETQIRNAADRLNMLTLARSATGARRGRMSVTVGDLPGTQGLGGVSKTEGAGVSGKRGTEE